MLSTRICELFGIQHPIISAPMAGASGATLAAAVSNAGGLGMLGGNTNNAEWLTEQIRLVQSATDQPFGVGFITSNPDTTELMKIALEQRVPVIAHSFADPTPHIREASRLGLKTIVQVQSVGQALAAVEAGADVVAAQGMEAGGHTGYISPTLPLVPAVIDAIRPVPVVAAGGIADGRGLAAVLMLGADGAWIGTRFAASVESTSEDYVKEQIVANGADDFLLTRVFDIVNDAPFPDDVGERILRNEFTETWHGRESELTERKSELREQLRLAREAGDHRFTRVLAGNCAGLVHGIEPAADIVWRLVDEAEELLLTRPQELLSGAPGPDSKLHEPT